MAAATSETAKQAEDDAERLLAERYCDLSEAGFPPMTALAIAQGYETEQAAAAHQSAA